MQCTITWGSVVLCNAMEVLASTKHDVCFHIALSPRKRGGKCRRMSRRRRRQRPRRRSRRRGKNIPRNRSRRKEQSAGARQIRNLWRSLPARKHRTLNDLNHVMARIVKIRFQEHTSTRISFKVILFQELPCATDGWWMLEDASLWLVDSLSFSMFQH